MIYTCPRCGNAYVVEGVSGLICPLHLNGLAAGTLPPASPMSNPSGVQPVVGGGRDASQAPGSPAGKSAGGARPPFQPKPIEKQDVPRMAEAEMFAWIGEYKAGRAQVADKKHFFRLLDAQEAAGLKGKGKIRDVIDQIPTNILYPILKEIGVLKAVPCSIEACEEAGSFTAVDVDGVAQPVCQAHKDAITAGQAAKSVFKKAGGK